MVNSQLENPVVVASDGCYTSSWEFLTALDFEWRVLRWHRQSGPQNSKSTSHPWTIWLHCLTRMTTLMAVIGYLYDLNVTTQINCQVLTCHNLKAFIIFEMVIFEEKLLVPCLFPLGPRLPGPCHRSSLIVLRINTSTPSKWALTEPTSKVIWDGNSAMLMIAACIWMINSAFLVLGIARLRSEWVPAGGGGCDTYNIQATKVTMIVAFVSDIILLIIMLVGLFRDDHHRSDAFGWGRLLWKQCSQFNNFYDAEGVVWLLLATVAGILPTVFVCLDLNAPLSVVRSYLLRVGKGYGFVKSFRDADIPDALAGHNVDRCHTDASRSEILRHCVVESYAKRVPVEALRNDGHGSGDEMFKPQHAPPWATSITLDNLEDGGHSRRGESERDVTYESASQ
ncbi:hypothetical protein BJV74DRAFT_904493 [Russula compacta]|nr:hypothetical protein BJV74DRAFT_904493 [Russula compacta]